MSETPTERDVAVVATCPNCGQKFAADASAIAAQRDALLALESAARRMWEHVDLLAYGAGVCIHQTDIISNRAYRDFLMMAETLDALDEARAAIEKAKP